MPELSEREQGVELVLLPDDQARLANLCGQFDEHLRQVENRLGLSIRSRGNRFELRGPETQARQGSEVLKRLYELADSEDLDPEKVHLTIAAVANQNDTSSGVIIHARRREVCASVRTRRFELRQRHSKSSKCLLRSSQAIPKAFRQSACGAVRTLVQRSNNFVGSKHPQG